MTFHRWVIAGLGTLSALTAVLFVLAPVEQDVTTYEWPSGPDTSSTALPLFPYEPDRMDVEFGCADVVALGENSTVSTVLSTTTDNLDVDQHTSAGLTLKVSHDTLSAQVGDHSVMSRPVGADCVASVHSDSGGTTVNIDGVVAGHTQARPVVNSLHTDLASAGSLRVTVVPDTRYETSPSAVKLALGAVTVAGLLAMLMLLSRWEAARVRHVRLLPVGWWRPRLADAVVALVLAAWAVIGSPTVDDGYIIAMLKAADDTGFVGNYFRWFNAPEAPFSWFYELYRPFVEVSGDAWWMRVPSVLLGLALWLLIDRLLLRRLATGPRAAARWTACVVFLAWYVQFGIGLRPEPWVMFGTLVVFALVERAVATLALTPLAAGVLAAGATVAVTPTGLVALAPFVAALPGVIRLVRAHWPVSLPVLLGSGAGALLLMFFDQSLSAVLHSTEVRTAIGPSFGVLDEGERYQDVFDPLQGGLNRRMPLLLLWLSTAALAVLLLTRRVRGLAAAPTRRLLIVGALFFLALAFTPTKYTHHFGAVGGVATILAAALVHTVASGALRRAWQRSLLVVAIAVTAAVALAVPVRWWYIANLNVKWSTVPPGFLGIDLADVVLVGGVSLALVGLVGVGRSLVRSPGVFLTLAAAGTVLLEVGTMAYAMVPRWDTYTMGRSNIAALGGGSCGVEDWLDVEPDLAAGLLRPVNAGERARLSGFTVNGGFPEDVAPVRPYGTEVAPVWGSGGGAGSVTTGWYSLPERAASADAPPLVVPVGGQGLVSAKVQFADADGQVERELSLRLDREGEWRDARFAPGHARLVRVLATDERDGEGWIAVGAPRLPEVVPLSDYIPITEPVAVDWIDAFLLPCRQPAALADGIVEPVRYRFASGPSIRRLGSMSFVAGAGGPYVPLLQLAAQTPVPTYLRGDKLVEPISVFRLDYPVPMRDSLVTGSRRTPE